MRDGTNPPRWDPAAARLITLARNAHRGVDQSDDVDYWYRLGQRNAYAHAAGLLLAEGVDSDAFAVSERVTGALTDGVSDLGALADAAVGSRQGKANAGASLTWLGRLEFRRQLAHLPGVDHDCGMRWGSTGDQRLTLRHPTGADRGLLYAYDPIWDEYAVLGRNVPVAAVDAAFARAVQSDIHMSPADFAALALLEPPVPTSVGGAACQGVRR